ncbi:hypothetical protein AB3Z07_06165 [Metabacillus halosaccharovorans]|uniref:hypothetical protein n=1 Tax=Bacillaceae TaxID=186817 RepID=UPI0004AF48F5|nr:hypothetical protein [Bacillus sp. J37]
MKELLKVIEWKPIIIFIVLSLLIILAGVYYANHYLTGVNYPTFLSFLKHI